MRKEKLLEIVSEKSGLSQQAVSNVLKALREVVTDSLKRKERVVVAGLGVFDVGSRAARKARNPQSGELMKISAMRVPRFRAAVSLKKAVR